MLNWVSESNIFCELHFLNSEKGKVHFVFEIGVSLSVSSKRNNYIHNDFDNLCVHCRIGKCLSKNKKCWKIYEESMFYLKTQISSIELNAP